VVFELLWTRTEDQERFELCCIPFFPYGMALGDLVSWDDATHRAHVAVLSGRGTVGVALQHSGRAIGFTTRCTANWLRLNS
jgi:hypothetical protein